MTKVKVPLYVFVFCTAVLFSCSGQDSNKKKPFELQESFEYVHLIPDSLRTQSQNELFERLLEAVVMNMKVIDNRLIFGLSESEFLNRKIPKPYYDLLQHNILEINEYIETNKIEGLDSILTESYKDIYTRFKEVEDKPNSQ